MGQIKAIETDLKEMELNALLEVTEAINNNLPEASLYKIYHFTLLANLKVRKLALFVLDQDQWKCKVHFGVPEDVCTTIHLEDFIHLRQTETIDSQENDIGFETVIPVTHKDRLLALVFLGDVLHSVQSNGPSATTFLEALTNITLVAIENKRLARQQLEQEAFKKELEIAKQVQHYLIPKSLPVTEKFEVAAFYQPHHNVGGDYYDYIEIDENQFFLCIADVSGKGIPAALMMSNFQASLRTMVRQTDDLQRIVSELNYQIKISGNGEIFITFFAAIYNSKTKEIQYVNCGHNPPLIQINGGKFEELTVGTTVLGMFNPLPFMEQGNISSVENFFLFCYTDGLNEAIDPDENEFGEERIYDLLTEITVTCSPTTINKQIMEAVDSFRQGQEYRDDVTLLCAQLKA